MLPDFRWLKSCFSQWLSQCGFKFISNNFSFLKYHKLEKSAKPGDHCWCAPLWCVTYGEGHCHQWLTGSRHRVCGRNVISNTCKPWSEKPVPLSDLKSQEHISTYCFKEKLLPRDMLVFFPLSFQRKKNTYSSLCQVNISSLHIFFTILYYLPIWFVAVGWVESRLYDCILCKLTHMGKLEI